MLTPRCMFHSKAEAQAKSLRCWQSNDASLALSSGPAAQGNQEAKPEAEGKRKTQSKARARKVSIGCVPASAMASSEEACSQRVLRRHAHSNF